MSHPDPDAPPMIQPLDVDAADKLLVRELNSMSMQEIGQVYEEIHGVHQVINETPEFVQERLAALTANLHRIPLKEAYDIAYRKGPQYVTDPKFLLMFLRADEFDAAKASDRVVKFHEGLRQYFGTGVLGRPLTLLDLNKDDMVCLKAGALQRLTSRDSSGRAVVVEQTNMMLTKFYKHADNVIRATLYFLITLVQTDELSQKRGLVAVMYFIGSTIFGQEIDEELWKKGPEVLPWLPFRYTAFHLCTNDVVSHVLTPIFKLAIGRKHRCRLRVHNGEHMECRYRLMSFGIPVDCFPVTYDGKAKTKDHHKWIAKQRIREDSLRTEGSFRGVDLPGDRDVLLGRGKAIYSHKGNVWMKHLVNEYFDHFEDAKYGEKFLITATLVSNIKQEGGRFLKLRSDGWWEVADDKLAADKVSHAFRTARLETGSSPRTNTATTSGAAKKIRM
ncbi:MAG: hypothetical protein SGILL_004920 [Bacillariaceae sp.]